MGCPWRYFGLLPGAHPEVVALAVRLRLLQDHPDKGGSADALRRTRMASKAIESGGDLPPAQRDTSTLGAELGAAFASFRGGRKRR